MLLLLGKGGSLASLSVFLAVCHLTVIIRVTVDCRFSVRTGLLLDDMHLVLVNYLGGGRLLPPTAVFLIHMGGVVFDP